jgi:hypothetical protein
MVLFAGAFWRSHYRPRWHWDRGSIRALLRESFALAIAAFVYGLRLLLPSAREEGKPATHCRHDTPPNAQTA